MESFGLILQNLNFICIIGIVESYLGLWGKRVNFGITMAEIQQKVWERRRKRGEREKILNFGNVNTEIPLPNSCCLGMKCAWSAQSEKKKKIVTIVAMLLPKIRGKKKIMVAEIWGGIKKKFYVHNIFTTFSQQIIGD